MPGNTVQTRKLGTYLLDRPHWIAGRWWISVGKEKRFLEGQSSPQSIAFRFAWGISQRWHSWSQKFPEPLRKDPRCQPLQRHTWHCVRSSTAAMGTPAGVSERQVGGTSLT